jgi:hypothetical protein
MADAPPIARTIARWVQDSGIGKTKLYALINQGELPVVRIDNRTLILEEDMLACLKRHREFRGPPPNGSPTAAEPNGSPPAPPTAVERAHPPLAGLSPTNPPQRRGRPPKKPRPPR